MIIFSIFIPGEVPSAKNSKVWTGKYLVYSKVASTYIRKTSMIWKNKSLINQFRKRILEVKQPYKLSFKLIRNSHRRFDYVNLIQLPLDLMVTNGWLEDDNSNVVFPIFEQYEINKMSPGIIISLIK